MTVVASYLYRDGKRVREVAIDERVDCAKSKSEFVWIGVANPTTEELATLQQTTLRPKISTAMARTISQFGRKLMQP